MTDPKHMGQTLVVSECDCDFQRRLTLGATLRMVQTLSTMHSESLGATFEKHSQAGTAFLLAKMSVRMQKPVLAGSTLALDTYPSDMVRAVFHRYTTLRLEDGSLAGAVDARWVLVDTQRGRILRKNPPELGLQFAGLAIAAEHGLAFPKPELLTPLGEETASYGRCDQNRHLNNTRYGDIVCDHIPLFAFESDFIRQFVILYHRELPMGETMTLTGGQPDPQSYYFAGDREGHSCFEAFASMAPAEVPEPVVQ